MSDNPNVRSAPPPARPRKPTAIIKAATAERVANNVIRYGAIALWPLSAAGTVAAVNGGWPAPVGIQPALSMTAIAGGLALQVLLTIFEYGFARKRRSPLWWGPFIGDVAATHIGYSSILIAPFAARFASAGIEPAPLLAHVLLLLISIIVAYAPEEALIE